RRESCLRLALARRDRRTLTADPAQQWFTTLEPTRCRRAIGPHGRLWLRGRTDDPLRRWWQYRAAKLRLAANHARVTKVTGASALAAGRSPFVPHTSCVHGPHRRSAAQIEGACPRGCSLRA